MNFSNKVLEQIVELRKRIFEKKKIEFGDPTAYSLNLIMNELPRFFSIEDIIDIYEEMKEEEESELNDRLDKLREEREELETEKKELYKDRDEEKEDVLLKYKEAALNAIRNQSSPEASYKICIILDEIYQRLKSPNGDIKT